MRETRWGGQEAPNRRIGVLSETPLNPEGEGPVLRSAGEVCPGEGIAMPKPGGEEELGVFQKQETSPRDSSVRHGRQAGNDGVGDVSKGHHAGPV